MSKNLYSDSSTAPTDEQIKNLIRDYNYSSDWGVRRRAGEKLGYDVTKMIKHEYLMPLYWIYGKITGKRK